MENNKYVEIDEYELARLYRLDGRVDAVQDYVDNADFLDADEIILILGIDTTKLNIRKSKEINGERE